MTGRGVGVQGDAGIGGVEDIVGVRDIGGSEYL